MSNENKNRRMANGSELITSLTSLDKVPASHRAGFVHDSLMSAIDDIFRTHENGTGALFNKKQKDIIRDIAFQVVYILDVRNHPSKNVFKRLYSGFVDLKFADKTIIALMALPVFSGFIGGMLSLGKLIFSFFSVE